MGMMALATLELLGPIMPRMVLSPTIAVAF
jgi:hypothetical protein